MGVKEKCIRSASAAETHALAAAIAARMPAGTVIAAQGDLGMGKTVFAAGLAAGLGVSDTVTSPTYIFFNEAALLPYRRLPPGRPYGRGDQPDRHRRLLPPRKDGFCRMAGFYRRLSAAGYDLAAHSAGRCAGTAAAHVFLF